MGWNEFARRRPRAAGGRAARPRPRCAEAGCLWNLSGRCHLRWIEPPRGFGILNRNYCPNYLIVEGRELLVAVSSVT